MGLQTPAPERCQGGGFQRRAPRALRSSVGERPAECHFKIRRMGESDLHERRRETLWRQALKRLRRHPPSPPDLRLPRRLSALSPVRGWTSSVSAIPGYRVLLSMTNCAFRGRTAW